MATAALFTIAKLCNQPRCIYTVTYYSAIKNEILSLAGKWMDMEDLI